MFPQTHPSKNRSARLGSTLDRHKLLKFKGVPIYALEHTLAVLEHRNLRKFQVALNRSNLNDKLCVTRTYSSTDRNIRVSSYIPIMPWTSNSSSFVRSPSWIIHLKQGSELPNSVNPSRWSNMFGININAHRIIRCRLHRITSRNENPHQTSLHMFLRYSIEGCYVVLQWKLCTNTVFRPKGSC